MTVVSDIYENMFAQIVYENNRIIQREGCNSIHRRIKSELYATPLINRNNAHYIDKGLPIVIKLKISQRILQKKTTHNQDVNMVFLSVLFGAILAELYV